MSYDLYTSLLRMHDTFRAATVDAPLAVDFSAPELAALREQYGLAAIAGEGNALDRAVRVMDWLTAHVRHDGPSAFRRDTWPCRYSPLPLTSRTRA